MAQTDIVLQRSIDMMYRGQWRSLAVPVPSPITSIEALVADFHREHQREYNFRRDDAPVSFFRVNVKAIGVVPKAELAVHEPTGGETPDPVSRRTVWFDNAPTKHRSSARRPALRLPFRGPGDRRAGGLDRRRAAGSLAEVDKYLNIIIRVKG